MDDPQSVSGHRIVVIGGGVGGLLTAMLLAEDGHRVDVVERDPAEPTSPADAWDNWERNSVRQFHMGHFFLPRFHTELLANLPQVAEAMAEIGALRTNPIKEMPEHISGGWRVGDERFESLTGRRPVIEATIARCAADVQGVTIHRGKTVTELIAQRPDPEQPIHITGVRTDDGITFEADLVVDTSGRNSGLPKLLKAAGAPAPVQQSDDSGFVYYGRAYRSDDGSLPFSFGAGLQPYGSIATLTLSADNGTWQVAFVASGRDKAMRKVRDEKTFQKVWSNFPLVAHWLDGEAISEIETMANIEDRIRRFVIDGSPVATGLAAVGDSWACTNPSVGRGATMAFIHAIALRDHLRSQPLDDALAWSLGWDRKTEVSVEPFLTETLRADKHRLAQIEAAMEDRPYLTDDPSHAFVEALPNAARHDPDVMRVYLDTFMMHQLVDDAMADQEMVDRVLRLGADPEPAPGPSRAELESLLG